MTDSSKPKRIQRQRTKGWRMPEGTVYVGRPTKWGNPFNDGMWQRLRFVGVPIRLDDATNSHGDMAFRVVALSLESALSLYRDALNHPGEDAPWPLVSVEEILQHLRGRDLACWCPLDRPCHADILIEIANGT